MKQIDVNVKCLLSHLGSEDLLIPTVRKIRLPSVLYFQNRFKGNFKLFKAGLASEKVHSIPLPGLEQI